MGRFNTILSHVFSKEEDYNEDELLGNSDDEAEAAAAAATNVDAGGDQVMIEDLEDLDDDAVLSFDLPDDADQA